MTKEFIPYEEALALKELGFDELCFISDMIVELKEYVNEKESTVPRPLYQQAFRWFREKGLRFCIIDDHSSNETPYSFTTDHEYYYDWFWKQLV